MSRLYHHQTDGGAEYLCSKHINDSEEGDLHYAVVRLDGDPELLIAIVAPSMPAKPPVELTQEDWVEIYYAVLDKSQGAAVTSDPKWVAHMNEILDQIGPDGANMSAPEKPPTIIIEQAEGLIQAVWSTDPNISCQTFYNEDDPPEDGDTEDWKTTLEECRAEIRARGMVDLIDPNRAAEMEGEPDEG